MLETVSVFKEATVGCFESGLCYFFNMNVATV